MESQVPSQEQLVANHRRGVSVRNREAGAAASNWRSCLWLEACSVKRVRGVQSGVLQLARAVR